MRENRKEGRLWYVATANPGAEGGVEEREISSDQSGFDRDILVVLAILATTEGWRCLQIVDQFAAYLVRDVETPQ